MKHVNTKVFIGALTGPAACIIVHCFLVSTRVVKVQVPLDSKMCRYMGGYHKYMCMYVCMYVCMYIYIYIFVFTCAVHFLYVYVWLIYEKESE